MGGGARYSIPYLSIRATSPLIREL
jgi:hypothetical protein